MRGNATPDTTPAAAPTETERTLLQIWSEVLKMDAIDIHDDFLGLGGDSMMAMRCINRISAAFGVELPLYLFLLDSPPISQIASEIERIRLETANIAAPDNG